MFLWDMQICCVEHQTQLHLHCYSASLHASGTSRMDVGRAEHEKHGVEDVRVGDGIVDFGSATLISPHWDRRSSQPLSQYPGALTPCTHTAYMRANLTTITGSTTQFALHRADDVQAMAKAPAVASLHPVRLRQHQEEDHPLRQLR